jgi:hypothetical protein
MGSYPELKRVCATYPAIDNHCHPLLTAAAERAAPFTSLVSEAQGAAAVHAPHTLAALRAARELAPLFSLDDNASWDAVHAAVRDSDYAERCRVAFAPTNIQCLLLDDGLADAGAFKVSDHDQFTFSPSRRIVRVEAIAQVLLRQLFDAALSSAGTPDALDASALLASFEASLDEELDALARSETVAGFKSVVCYRTGLAIALSATPDELADAMRALGGRYAASVAAGAPALRLEDKPLNDLVVRAALRACATHNKPLQFHTGLGDADLLLSLASPALLQPLLRAYPRAQVVLLHAAYPFTREAAWLAATHANAWLDLGEVWPFVSGAGQRAAVRAALELAPLDKLLWSSACARSAGAGGG